jgi:glycosyltransferase involved in cell wall biosynthesis
MPSAGATAASAMAPSSSAASKRDALITLGINGRFLSQPFTGVQRYAWNIVKAIDAILDRDAAFSGIDATLFCDGACKTRLDLARIRTVKGKRSGYAWEQLELPRHRMHALISLGNMGPLAIRQQLLCIHDTNVFDVPDSYAPAFRTVSRTFLRLLGRNCRAIATVSEFSCERLRQRRIVSPSKKILIAYDGHEHALGWSADRSTLPERLRPGRFFLMVGSYAKHKNFSTVLAGAERLAPRGFDIAVAGNPGTVFADMLGASATGNAIFLGSVSDDALAWLYRNATAVAVPSIQEGFGLPALEALTLGCPVVSSRGGSLPEVCGDAALYVETMDVGGWVAALSRVADDAGLRRTMVAAGAAQISKFSWKESAHKILTVARDLATDSAN